MVLMGVKGGESEARRAAGGGRGRCLMLVPRGFDAPPDLIEGMRQRGVALDEVADAPAVMVALARGRYLSLVVVEPQAVLEMEELLESVRDYHGPMPIWRYVAEGHPRLSRLTPKQEAENSSSGASNPGGGSTGSNGHAEASPARSVAGRIRPSTRRRRDMADTDRDSPAPMRRGGAAPGIRYTGDDTPEAEEREERSEPADTDPPEIRITLSEEELAMLLDEDFDSDAWPPPDEQEGSR